jgi:formate dehydrogenase major subunit
MKGNEVVRMVPWKDGGANHGHSCVKGRFAWGYATHPDRITKPMIRARSRAVARGVVGRGDRLRRREFKRIQAKYGRGAVGGITSSRCTNEETYLVQKLVRAAFGNNNVDTCARVCHSPTGYGLKQTLGESAGTQDFDSVEQGRRDRGDRRQPDRRAPGVRLAHEARLREGAKLIVVDPRRIDLVRSPHVEAPHHLQLRPGTNVAVINALAHVIVTEGLVDEAFVRERCDPAAFAQVARVHRRSRRTRPRR